MSKSTKANNSKLFIQAHKMTRLTIQKGYIYRYVFGQWLKFLSTGVTNYIRPSSINKECAMVLNTSVPILKHDTEGKEVFITPFTITKPTSNRYTYKLSLPLTLTRSKQSGYSESYYLGKMLLSSGFIAIAIIIMQFILILKFI